MLPLKLLANGFDYQLKTGQDVKKNIEQVHSMFLLFQASGEADKFVAKMLAAEDERPIEEPGDSSGNTGVGANDLPGSYPPGFQADAIPNTNPDFVEPYISEQDRTEIAAAKERDAQERAQILQTAKELNLPYTIEALSQQWIIYSSAMKGGKGGGGGGGGGTNPPTTGHKPVGSWGFRRGDVVWTNGTGSIAGVPGHVAILWGQGSEVYLNDANTDVGVSRAQDIQKWFDRYSEIRALTPKLNWDLNEFYCYTNGGICFRDSWARQNAWAWTNTWANEKRPYNWNFINPQDLTSFYCTSLVWNAYKKVGYNAISPFLVAPGVIIYPQAIRDSYFFSTFKVSKK